jgi:hypothetical protein
VLLRAPDIGLMGRKGNRAALAGRFVGLSVLTKKGRAVRPFASLLFPPGFAAQSQRAAALPVAC